MPRTSLVRRWRENNESISLMTQDQVNHQADHQSDNQFNGCQKRCAYFEDDQEYANILRRQDGDIQDQ